MKSFLIIGMGEFGKHICRKLIELDNDIMIVDQREEQLRDFFTDVSAARIGDCTNPDVLDALGIKNFDVIIVAIKENFQNSLEITNLAKEKGAKWVISLASREIQAKFLLKNGADEVVYPERDAAHSIAVKASANHVFEYIELDGDYSIYELPIIKEWVGHSIKDLNVSSRYNINIIGVVANGVTNIMPGANYVFKDGDHMQIIASMEDANKIFKILDAQK